MNDMTGSKKALILQVARTIGAQQRNLLLPKSSKCAVA